MYRRALAPTLIALAAGVAGCGTGPGGPRASSPSSPGASTAPPRLAAGPWKPGPALELRGGTGAGAASLAFPGKEEAAVIVAGNVSAEIPVGRVDYPYEDSSSLGADSSVVGSPAFDRTGRGVIVWQTPASETNGSEVRLHWAGMSRHGGIGPVHDLSDLAEFPTFTAQSDGNAVVSWSEPLPGGQEAAFKVAVQASSQAFGPAVTLAEHGAETYLDGNGIGGNSFVATVAPGGRLLAGGLVYRGEDVAIQAWTGTVDAGFAAAPIAVAAESGQGFTAAAAKDGRGYLAWGHQVSGEEADSPWLVRAASIPADGRTATAVQEVEHGEKDFPAALPALVSDPRGGALLAWNGVRRVRGAGGLQSPVLIRNSGPGGRFGKPQELAADGALISLLVDPSGAAIATWNHTPYESDDPSADSTYAASVRPAGRGRFGAAERVPLPFPADTPVPAFDAEGRPAVAYTVPNTKGARRDTIHVLIRKMP